MDPLSLGVAMLLSLRLFLVFLLLGQRRIEVDLGEFVDQIREHKRIRIVRINKIAALLGQISFVRFLVDRKEEFFLERKQLFLAGVLIKGKLRFIYRAALVGIFHHAQELLVARLPELHFEHEPAARLYVTLLELLKRFACQSVTEHVLLANKLLDKRFPFVVLMRRDRRRAADDERGPRFVDQDGIDFIDNRVIIAALHLLFARRCHAVVAEIIEPALTVRPVSNVHCVLFATEIRFLIVLNATNRELEKIVE